MFSIIKKCNVYLPEGEKHRHGKKVEGDASTLFYIFHASKCQSGLYFAALAPGIK